MSTKNMHAAAINLLARRISRASDLTQANSLAPAVAALALDGPDDPGDPTDPSGSGGSDGDNVGDAFPELPPNKTIVCTTAFREASMSLNQSIATVKAELKSTKLTAQQKTALEQKLASLEHAMAIAITNYTQCLRKAVAFV